MRQIRSLLLLAFLMMTAAWLPGSLAYGQTLVSDTNTWLLSTGATAATANPGSIGNGWIDVIGNKWSVDSANHLNGLSASGSYTTNDLKRQASENVTDGQIRLNAVCGGSSNETWVKLRYKDANNWYGIKAKWDSATYNLYKVVGGSATSLSGDVPFVTQTSGHFYDMILTVQGTTVSAQIIDTTSSTSGSVNSFTDSSITGAGSYAIQQYVGTTNIVRVRTYSYTTPAFTISPTSGATSTAPTITATGNGATAWTSGTTFSVSGGTGASISSTSVNVGAQTATFTLTTGSATGALTISDSTDSATATYTVAAAATGCSLTGPTTGVVNTASSNFTATLTPSGGLSSGVVYTPASTVAGAFSPSTITLSTGTPSATFTYTPTATGTATISATNNGSLANPSNLTYTVTTGPLTVLPNDSNIFYSPYTWYTTSAVAVPVSSGAYYKFGFTGTSLKMNLDTTNGAVPPYLKWSVDGGVYQFTSNGYSTGVWTLASGLASGNHTIICYIPRISGGGDRWTATSTAFYRILSWTLDAGASTQACSGYIAIKPNRFLFYGDSRTEGPYNPGGGTNSDATSAYCEPIATAYNAEYGQVGYSGTGWTASYLSVPQFYNGGGTGFWNNLDSAHSRLVTGKLSPIPDYVSIMQGVNDVSGTAGTNSSIPALVTGSLTAIRAACGNGYGTGVSTKVFLNIDFGGYAITETTSGFNTYQGTPDANTYLIDVHNTMRVGADQKGISSAATVFTIDGLHPTAERHGELAGALISAFKAATGTTTTVTTNANKGIHSGGKL